MNKNLDVNLILGLGNEDVPLKPGVTLFLECFEAVVSHSLPTPIGYGPPACLFKQLVDILSCLFFGLHRRKPFKEGLCLKAF